MANDLLEFRQAGPAIAARLQGPGDIANVTYCAAGERVADRVEADPKAGADHRLDLDKFSGCCARHVAALAEFFRIEPPARLLRPNANPAVQRIVDERGSAIPRSVEFFDEIALPAKRALSEIVPDQGPTVGRKPIFR